ncbi:ArsR/SmtB family transcription factor [Kineococcus arenarius]|uniref:ArsR/SmtB family transcription factor n=1 Tax=unclassified Kineococcus TaxID=2621656 RepID=UPI003D7E3D97
MNVKDGDRRDAALDTSRTTATEMSNVFAALGDPVRQYLLEELAAVGAASVTSLAAPVDVSRQAVDKHLRVLQRAGLVQSGRAGREVLWHVRPEELLRSASWLSALAEGWQRRLMGIKALAEADGAEAHPDDVS